MMYQVIKAQLSGYDDIGIAVSVIRVMVPSLI